MPGKRKRGKKANPIGRKAREARGDDVEVVSRGQMRKTDAVATLQRAGKIGLAELQAADFFRGDFVASHRPGLRAAGMDRSGAARSAVPPPLASWVNESSLERGQRLDAAMARLGGRNSLCGAIAIAVIGEGESLREWAGARPWFSSKSAGGVLVAALDLLALFYDLKKSA